MKYKVGDWIIFIDKEGSEVWKDDQGVSLYNQIAKIIYIDELCNQYLVEFKKWINGHNGEGRGKEGHCISIGSYRKIVSLNQLKLKKFIKYGV